MRAQFPRANTCRPVPRTTKRRMIGKRRTASTQARTHTANTVSSWRSFETLGSRPHPAVPRARLCQIRGGRGGQRTHGQHTRRQAGLRMSEECEGSCQCDGIDKWRQDRQSLPGNQRRRRDTQTCNAFEASAALTPGQGSGASVGSLRRKMRRRLSRLGLAVRASGERVQIAVLLGGSEARRTGPGPVNPSLLTVATLWTDTPYLSSRWSPWSLSSLVFACNRSSC